MNIYSVNRYSGNFSYWWNWRCCLRFYSVSGGFKRGSNMLKIAIIDDDMRETEALIACLNRYEKESGVMLEIDTFKHAELFLEKYTPIYDLVYLDICMDGMDGLRAAKKLRELDENVFLIFVTNMAQMAIKGYKYDALDYFVKPVNYYDLKMRMERVRRAKKAPSSTVFIQYNGMKKLLNLKDIYYIEVIAHQVIYHTGKESYETRNTMAKVESELGPQGFFRCNYCYLVNMRHCTKIEDHTVTVGEFKLSISRPKYKAFVEAFIRFSTNLKGGR